VPGFFIGGARPSAINTNPASVLQIRLAESHFSTPSVRRRTDDMFKGAHDQHGW
jgi:hypothetical protein